MHISSKFKATVLTMFAAVFNAVILSVFNLIYSRLIIQNYGSSVNGLISTLIQFVSLFTILEGGFSVAAVVASFEPIAQKDFKKVNNILFTITKYFFRIAGIFTLVSLVAGIIYIQFLDPVLSLTKTYSLLIITVLTTTVSFGFVSKYSIVISGDNRGYIKSIMAIFSKTVTWIASVILILTDKSIILVYSLTLLNVIINAVLLRAYERKCYSYATYKGIYQPSLIKGTKDVFFQKIASTIFTSTDLMLISAGISLASASVYNIYNQIFHAVFNLLVSVVEAPFNSFGQIYGNGENDKVDNLFGIFAKITTLMSTILLSVVGMTIISFLTVYTQGIKDTNYIVPSLVLLFYTQYYCQLNNRPYGLILNVAGLFRMQNLQCGLAAVVNLLLSVIAMQFWGINGVIFGSIVGTTIILFMNIYQSFKYVVKSGALSDVIWLVLNYLIGLALIIAPSIRTYTLTSYAVWVIYGIAYFAIATVVVLFVNITFDRRKTMIAILYMTEKVKMKLKR